MFGRSTVFTNWKDAVVGQETPAQSGGVQESVDMFTDTFLPIADIPVDSTTRVAQKPQGAREGGAGRRGAKKLRTQIYMDLRYIDPQARVLNCCYK